MEKIHLHIYLAKEKIHLPLLKIVKILFIHPKYICIFIKIECSNFQFECVS